MPLIANFQFVETLCITFLKTDTRSLSLVKEYAKMDESEHAKLKNLLL